MAPGGLWGGKATAMAEWGLQPGWLSRKDALPPAEGPVGAGEVGGGCRDTALGTGGHGRCLVWQPRGHAGLGTAGTKGRMEGEGRGRGWVLGGKEAGQASNQGLLRC